MRTNQDYKVLHNALKELLDAGNEHMSVHQSEGRAFIESNAKFYRALNAATVALKVME